MGKKKVRRFYSEDFKANAVKISLKPGVSVSQVAEELDVSVGYLSKWRVMPVLPKIRLLLKPEWMRSARMHA